MDEDADPVGSGWSGDDRGAGPSPEVAPAFDGDSGSPEPAGPAVVKNLDGTPWSETAERDRAIKEIKARQGRAAEKKRDYEAMLAGAQLRAERTDRLRIGKFGFAAAEIMLARVVNGEVEIRSVKEAMDVARVGLEIGRLELGDPAANPTELTPERRKQLIANAKKLEPELKARREELERIAAEKTAEMDEQPEAPAEETG